MKNKNKIEMGKRIAIIRQQLGLTQQEFASKFSPPASKAAVSRWESGDRTPSNDSLKQIAKLGNVSVTYLRTGYTLNFLETRALLNRAIHGDKLNKDDQQKVNESRFDFLLQGIDLMERRDNEATNLLRTQAAIIDKKPLSPLDKSTLGDFLWLLNLIRLNGSEKQQAEFDVLINMLRQIASGSIKYDKDDLLPNIDKFLASFPVKKDNKKS